MYISSVAPEPNAELLLQPEVLKDRGTTYTSLSDLYQVSVFTNDMVEQTKGIQDEKSEQEHKVQESIFINKEVTNKQEVPLKERLFVTMAGMTKKQDYREAEKVGSSYFMVVVVFISVLFGAVLYRYSYIRKKKRLEYAKEYYHDE